MIKMYGLKVYVCTSLYWYFFGLAKVFSSEYDVGM